MGFVLFVVLFGQIKCGLFKAVVKYDICRLMVKKTLIELFQVSVLFLLPQKVSINQR